METPPSAREYNVPLLQDSNDYEMTDLPHPAVAAPRKEQSTSILALLTLCIVLIGFTTQTEAVAYVEEVLEWKKPYFVMYVTHSSWTLPWLGHLVFLRYSYNRSLTWRVFLRRYVEQLRSISATVESYAASSGIIRARWGSPLQYMLTVMAGLSIPMTIVGGSFFLAAELTTPSDLTAIFNCSTFFAAGFSVPVLRAKLDISTIIAVVVSMAGTFVIAYGDSGPSEDKLPPMPMKPHVPSGTLRILGNIIVLIGATTLGLYEVLYKKWACPPKTTSPHNSVTFAIATGAVTGVLTLSTLWVGMIVLHLTGWEPFEFPTGPAAFWLFISVIAGAISMTGLLILISLTNPIFSSVASLLSIFLVAIADWFLNGIIPSPATCIGGVMIMASFVLVARSELHS